MSVSMITIAIFVGAAVACFITAVKRICNNYIRSRNNLKSSYKRLRAKTGESK